MRLAAVEAVSLLESLGLRLSLNLILNNSYNFYLTNEDKSSLLVNLNF